ncbi:MAG: glycosyltransferase family 4 protein, partial [Candidatus Binatia bacterium]
MLKYALLSGTAAILGLLLTPVVRYLARRLGAVDEPGGRHVHQHRIPRLGGLALLAAFLGTVGAGWVVDAWLTDVFFGYGWGLRWLLAGTVVVTAVGVADDIWSLGPVPKLCFQVLAGVLALLGGYGISAVTNPFTGGLVDLGWFAIPVTLLWVVGITNAFNLIDGLDGLAAGVALIVSTTLLLVSVAAGRVDAALLSATLAGAVAGFLYYNFGPASIFLGDSGRLLLGGDRGLYRFDPAT